MRTFVLTIITLIVVVLFASCGSEQKKSPDLQNIDSESTELELINKELKADSTNPDIYNLRAKYYLKNNQLNNALADINKSIQLDEENHIYYLTLSDIYLALGQGEKCEEALQKSFRLSDEDIELLLKLGEINFILKDYKDVIKYLNLALEIDDKNPTAYLIKGYAYLEGGDTARAIDNFLISRNNDENNYDANMQLGLIYSRKKNKLAVDYFNTALQINPNSIEALYALAMFYQNTFEIDKAIKNYDKILAIDSANANALYNTGYIYLVFSEDFSRASNYFTRAIQADSTYVNAWYNRGYCKELLGNFNDARMDYQKALDLHTNYQKAIDGLNRLDKKTMNQR